MNGRSLLIAGPGVHFAGSIAQRFAAENFEIGLMGRNPIKLQELSASLALAGVASYVILADFTSEASVANAVSRCSESMPPWESIIYNVKQSHHGDLLGVELNEALSDFDSNVLGAVRLVRNALKNWKRNAHASVILAGGGYKDNPSSDKLSLSLSKGALHTLALAMQVSLMESDVTIGEVVIDGIVREDGPLLPADLANVMWDTHARRINGIVQFPDA